MTINEENLFLQHLLRIEFPMGNPLLSEFWLESSEISIVFPALIRSSEVIAVLHFVTIGSLVSDRRSDDTCCYFNSYVVIFHAFKFIYKKWELPF